MKISVIADSVAMPRVEPPDDVRFNETWPNQLQVKLRNKLSQDIYLRNDCARRRVSTVLKDLFYEAIECVNPDYVIVQLGTVDCAPRIVSLKERHTFNRRLFPKKLRELIIANRTINRQKITMQDSLKRVYTKPADYAVNVTTFLNKLYKYNSNAKVILLPILADYSIVDAKSPGFKSNIELYNKMLGQIDAGNIHEIQSESFVSLVTEATDIFCSDGYHLAKNGHSMVSHYLSNEIVERCRRK